MSAPPEDKSAEAMKGDQQVQKPEENTADELAEPPQKPPETPTEAPKKGSMSEQSDGCGELARDAQCAIEKDSACV